MNVGSERAASASAVEGERSSLEGGVDRRVRSSLGAVLGHAEILLEAPPVPLSPAIRAGVEAVHRLAADALRSLDSLAATFAGGDSEPRLAELLRRQLRLPLRTVVANAETLLEDIEDERSERLLLDVRQIEKAGRSLLSYLDEQTGRVMTPGRSSTVEACAPDGGGEPVEGRPGRILVVDDSRTNRLVLTAHLEAEGYSVVAVSDGKDALESARSGAVDVVLMDVVMRGMSGLEALRLLRLRHSLAELPIIMVTSMAESEDTVTALGLGANDYVTKPIDFRVLAARIRTQISLRRATEQVQALASALRTRNEFIRATMDRYLSTQVVENLLETPDGLRLGGERRVASILMSDLRGFTALTQAVPPEQVVRILNRYLGTMSEIIREFDGTVDEFIGDAILALFGAPMMSPDDAERAVACAVKMQRAVEAINRANRQDGLPEIKMGVAVNTGEVIVGNMGSTQRAKYGAVGNPVNIAARVESYTVGGQVLITESTLRAAGEIIDADGPRTLQAQGLRVPIEVYEVRGIGGRHDLSVPRQEIPRAGLSRPRQVRCARMREKRQDGEEFVAEIVALSRDDAEISCPDAVRPLETLRLRFCDDAGADVAGDAYGKVLEAQPESGRFVLRFTAFDPSAHAWLLDALSRIEKG